MKGTAIRPLNDKAPNLNSPRVVNRERIMEIAERKRDIKIFAHVLCDFVMLQKSLFHSAAKARDSLSLFKCREFYCCSRAQDTEGIC